MGTVPISVQCRCSHPFCDIGSGSIGQAFSPDCFCALPANLPPYFPVGIHYLPLFFPSGGPFDLPAATMSTKILLSGMHVLAAGIITTGILFMSHKNSKSPEIPGGLLFVPTQKIMEETHFK